MSTCVIRGIMSSCPASNAAAKNCKLTLELGEFACQRCLQTPVWGATSTRSCKEQNSTLELGEFACQRCLQTPVWGATSTRSCKEQNSTSKNSYYGRRWISLLAFFCPHEQFTPGECVLPQKCCSTSASRKMGSYRRLFSFRKKLTNTRLSILGHHLTGGAPNMGQKRFSTDIFRRPRQSKGCRQAREYTRR